MPIFLLLLLGGAAIALLANKTKPTDCATIDFNSLPPDLQKSLGELATHALATGEPPEVLQRKGAELLDRAGFPRQAACLRAAAEAKRK